MVVYDNDDDRVDNKTALFDAINVGESTNAGAATNLRLYNNHHCHNSLIVLEIFQSTPTSINVMMIIIIANVV